MSTTVPTLLHVPFSDTPQRKYTYEYVKNTIDRSQTLAFDFDTEYSGLAKGGSTNSAIQINRQNVFMNEDYLEETLIGELVGNCSSTLFPLNLITNQFGFLKRIDKHEDIISRWDQIKPNLLLLYNSDTSLNFIHKVEGLYKSPENLLKSFQCDWFFITFFFPLYGNYGDNRIVELEYDFPISSSNKKETYHVYMELKDVNDENGKIAIVMHGKSLQKEENTLKGYILLNEDKTIHEIMFHFDFREYQEDIKIRIWERNN
ncbi:hypothetical protein [Chryseobacterium sp. c4a]|uniref:hypothetical protein n=1 Tax=Chryseobacterium sp. c4a TaxID=1573582 RepID=UPI001357074E|nr:hypothetical protein [Chryseobacterium sp. c4a]